MVATASVNIMVTRFIAFTHPRFGFWIHHMPGEANETFKQQSVRNAAPARQSVDHVSTSRHILRDRSTESATRPVTRTRHLPLPPPARPRMIVATSSHEYSPHAGADRRSRDPQSHRAAADDDAHGGCRGLRRR